MSPKPIILAAMLLVPAPAAASTVAGGWYMGDWQCTLDGRPTRMTWRIVSVDYGSSDGEVGTSVAGAERRGRLQDRGSWANLTFQRATSTTLNFRHADGNNWFLRRSASSAGQAAGYSTWNGRRYPFSCTKTR